jgi:hypothetical protein
MLHAPPLRKNSFGLLSRLLINGLRLGSKTWGIMPQGERRKSGVKRARDRGLLAAISFLLQQFFLSQFLFWLCGTTSMVMFPSPRGNSTAEEALWSFDES